MPTSANCKAQSKDAYAKERFQKDRKERRNNPVFPHQDSAPAKKQRQGKKRGPEMSRGASSEWTSSTAGFTAGKKKCK